MIIGHKLEIHQVELVRFSKNFCVPLLEFLIEIRCENILLNQVLSLLCICTQIFLLLFRLNLANLNEHLEQSIANLRYPKSRDSQKSNIVRNREARRVRDCTSGNRKWKRQVKEVRV